jgi:hypothetical protein
VFFFLVSLSSLGSSNLWVDKKFPYPNLTPFLSIPELTLALFYMFILISFDIVIKEVSKLTFLLSSISHLLPTRILQTPALANLIRLVKLKELKHFEKLTYRFHASTISHYQKSLYQSHHIL